MEVYYRHTPGPWRAGIEGNMRVYGPDGCGEHSGLIAEVFKGRGNVSLIASAPELLEKLDFFLHAYIGMLVFKYGADKTERLLEDPIEGKNVREAQALILKLHEA